MPFTGIYGGYTERDAQNRATETQGLAQLQAAQGIMAKMQEMQDRSKLSDLVKQSGGDPKAAMQALISAGTPQSLELAAKLHSLIPDPSQAALRNAQTLKAQVDAQQGISQLQGRTGLANLLNPQSDENKARFGDVSNLSLANSEAEALAKFGVKMNPDGTASPINQDNSGVVTAPMNVGVVNQNKLQSLLSQADPAAFVRGQMATMNRPPERPQVIPAGAGLRLPGEKVPSYTQPTAPRVDPLVVVQGANGPVYAPRSEAAGKPATTAASGSSVPLSIDSLDDAAIRYRSDGSVPPNLGRGGQNVAKIINRAAEMARAEGNSGEAERLQQIAGKAATVALTDLAKREAQVGAFEKTFVKNTELVDSLSKKVDRTGVPILNKWLNAGKRAVVGDPELSAFDATIKGAVNEYTKIVSGSMGNVAMAEGEIKKIEGLLNAAQTPEQISEVIKYMKLETQNRMAGFKEQKSELMHTITPKRRVSDLPALGTTTPSIPKYATEADAVKAGVKPGDRVEIGGQTGVWK